MSTLNNFELYAPIAEGAFGSVWRATDKTSGRTVAVKRIKNEKCTTSSFTAEVEAMREMSCEGTVAMLEHFGDSAERCIVMEMAEGGDMFHYVDKCNRLSDSEAKALFRQIISTVATIHERNWVHGDLKLENLLLMRKVESEPAATQHVKLGDFGFSHRQLPGALSFGMHGTAHYTAPEVLLQAANGYCGKAADVYACGVILYIMLCGRYPFPNRPNCGIGPGPMPEKITNLFRTQSGLERVVFPSDMSPAAVSLIRRMMDPSPTRRAAMGEVLQSSWLVGSDNWVRKPERSAEGSTRSSFGVPSPRIIDRSPEPEIEALAAAAAAAVATATPGAPAGPFRPPVNTGAASRQGSAASARQASSTRSSGSRTSSRRPPSRTPSVCSDAVSESGDDNSVVSRLGAELWTSRATLDMLRSEGMTESSLRPMLQDIHRLEQRLEAAQRVAEAKKRAEAERAAEAKRRAAEAAARAAAEAERRAQEAAQAAAERERAAREQELRRELAELERKLCEELGTLSVLQSLAATGMAVAVARQVEVVEQLQASIGAKRLALVQGGLAASWAAELDKLLGTTAVKQSKWSSYSLLMDSQLWLSLGRALDQITAAAS